MYYSINNRKTITKIPGFIVAGVLMILTICHLSADIIPDPCDEYEPQNQPMTEPCLIYVTMDSVEVLQGQGAAEGNLELIVEGFVDGERVIWPGGSNSRKVRVDDPPETINLPMEVYEVNPNQMQTIEICTTVTEIDEDIINGKHDVGQACEKVPIDCSMTPVDVVLEPKLCKGNKKDAQGNCKKYNGQVRVNFSISLEDEDDDDVPAPQDFTPECGDEDDKGQEGRAVMIFCATEPNAMTTIIEEELWDTEQINLNRVKKDYDYFVLLKEEEDFPGIDLSDKSFKDADYVLDPTKNNFFIGLRDIVSKGYDVDIYIVTDGQSVNGVAEFTTMDGVLTADEIAFRLAQPQSGTDSIPIRMVYTIASYQDEMNQVWIDVGAKVTSGSGNFNFHPNQINDFASSWNDGENYTRSLGFADTPWTRVTADFVEGQGITFGCDPYAGDGVKDLNPCAEAFFTSGSPYDLGSEYDVTESGEWNMNYSSKKIRQGDGNIDKFTMPLTW